ncbi:MAG: hypothetical protein ACRD68_12480 [Pyrinomonadaceae bacterium]
MLLCVVYLTATPFASAVAQEQKGERAREVSAVQAGEVVVVLNEQFFNALLEAMVTLAKPPRFPLARTGEGPKGNGAPSTSSAPCASEVVLARESSGKRTAVSFADGRINAPVAFRGTYDAALLGCLKFEGWAETSLELSFDRARQALTGRLTVREVNLKDVPALLDRGITDLVQSSIDQRVNPVQILRAEQLAARLPVVPGSVLRLRAKEVRHEIVEKDLRLRISYEILRDK